MKAIACRATWRVAAEDLELARNEIASKRLHLDDILNKVYGLQFFISSVTAVSTNANESRGNEFHSSDETIYPAVAYFIVYRETETCNENAIFTLLHNQETEPKVTGITTRVNERTGGAMEKAARQLFQVVKDHNNQMVLEMLEQSNVYCFNNCRRTTSAEDSDDEETLPNTVPHPAFPCRLVVVNTLEFNSQLHDAVTLIQSDGLKIEIESMLAVEARRPCLSSSTDELPFVFRKIATIMKICDHALYRGDIYAKPEAATMTYMKMMDIGGYLNKLLMNQAVRGMVLKHFASLLRILSHPACEIIRQIDFDTNLIEVSNGYCFKISTKSFVHQPIPLEQRGSLSPRSFVPYDCRKEPEPGYFKDGVINSFPDPEIRARFCNKFFQCLMAAKMPHKTRKLVVAGPKDSGKTSWASVFHRIVTPGRIASITNERHFAAAMMRTHNWCS